MLSLSEKPSKPGENVSNTLPEVELKIFHSILCRRGITVPLETLESWDENQIGEIRDWCRNHGSKTPEFLLDWIREKADENQTIVLVPILYR